MAQPSSPGNGSDWTVQAADSIESFVTTVRDKTVVPATTIARGLVYGVIAAFLGLTALILLVVGALRLLVVYLPFGQTPGRSVWVSDAIVGGIFTAFGLFLLRKANHNNNDRN